jgi:hypothetical protein
MNESHTGLRAAPHSVKISEIEPFPGVFASYSHAEIRAAFCKIAANFSAAALLAARRAWIEFRSSYSVNNRGIDANVCQRVLQIAEFQQIIQESSV